MNAAGRWVVSAVNSGEAMMRCALARLMPAVFSPVFWASHVGNLSGERRCKPSRGMMV